MLRSLSPTRRESSGSFAARPRRCRRRFSGDSSRRRREVLEEERLQHLEPFGDAFRWRYSPSAVVSILGELAAWGPPPEEIRQEVLLVRPSQESVVGPRQVEHLRHVLSERLQVVDVPGGHVVLWDTFAQTADAIADFLDGA